MHIPQTRLFSSYKMVLFLIIFSSKYIFLLFGSTTSAQIIIFISIAPYLSLLAQLSKQFYKAPKGTLPVSSTQLHQHMPLNVLVQKLVKQGKLRFRLKGQGDLRTSYVTCIECIKYTTEGAGQ